MQLFLKKKQRKPSLSISFSSGGNLNPLFKLHFGQCHRLVSFYVCWSWSVAYYGETQKGKVGQETTTSKKYQVLKVASFQKVFFSLWLHFRTTNLYVNCAFFWKEKLSEAKPPLIDISCVGTYFERLNRHMYMMWIMKLI